MSLSFILTELQKKSPKTPVRSTAEVKTTTNLTGHSVLERPSLCKNLPDLLKNMKAGRVFPQHGFGKHSNAGKSDCTPNFIHQLPAIQTFFFLFVGICV